MCQVEVQNSGLCNAALGAILPLATSLTFEVCSLAFAPTQHALLKIFQWWCRLEVEVHVEGRHAAAIEGLTVQASLHRCNDVGELDLAGTVWRTVLASIA